jgi:hypothetical protein
MTWLAAFYTKAPGVAIMMGNCDGRNGVVVAHITSAANTAEEIATLVITTPQFDIQYWKPPPSPFQARLRGWATKSSRAISRSWLDFIGQTQIDAGRPRSGASAE